MTDKGLKILLVGAGAVGGITAAFVSKAGCDLRILDKNPKIVERIRSAGLHVFGRRGEVRVSLPVFTDPAQISDKMDIIFLATKATALPGVVYELAMLMKPGSVVVSLQNGLCEEVIAGIIGKDATIGCVVGWGATMHEPGELEMTSTGDFIIGRLDGRTDEILSTVQKVLQSAAPTKVSSNIMGHLYAKLVINSCITTLGAVCGLYLGQMLGIRKVRNIFIGIIREAMDVAHTMGLKVEPVAKFDFGSFLRGTGFAARLRRHVMIRLIGFKYRRLKSSNLQSLERRERTEIDFFNGYIAAKGRELGVETPLNAFLTQVVKEIESEKRKITRANFDDSFFDSYR